MMNFPASLFPTKPPRRKWPYSQYDLVMYEALIGRPAVFITRPPVDESADQGPSGLEPILIIARQWKPKMAEMKVRLKTMYEQGIPATVKRPQVPGWLRNLSEHAVTRLDEAHVRLQAARITASDRRPKNGGVIMTLGAKQVTAGRARESAGRFKRVA